MTIDEAKAVRFIENIKNHAMVTLDHIAKEEPNVSPLFYKGREKKANTILIMVEELQQYRAIGTQEEFRKAMTVRREVQEIVDRQLVAGKNNYKEIYDCFWEIVKVVQANY